MSRISSRSFTRHVGPTHVLFALLLVAALLPFMAKATSSSPILPKLDVPFVPTPVEMVDKMLEMTKITSSDFVIDLGAGDGRIAVAAVRDYGAKGALGVDIDPERVQEARANAEQAGVADRVSFEIQDLFDTDFSKATVLTMYLLSDVNLKLRPKVLELAPGTRVVSHQFDMRDWEPDASAQVDGRDVYFWVVPAKVEGQWLLSGPDGDVQLDLKQSFQKVSGTAVAGKKPLAVNGILRGEHILLNIQNGDTAPQRYVGHVQGNTMVAAADNGAATQGWRASRR